MKNLFFIPIAELENGVLFFPSLSSSWFGFLGFVCFVYLFLLLLFCCWAILIFLLFYFFLTTDCPYITCRKHKLMQETWPMSRSHGQCTVIWLEVQCHLGLCRDLVLIKYGDLFICSCSGFSSSEHWFFLPVAGAEMKVCLLLRNAAVQQ